MTVQTIFKPLQVSRAVKIFLIREKQARFTDQCHLLKPTTWTVMVKHIRQRQFFILGWNKQISQVAAIILDQTAV